MRNLVPLLTLALMCSAVHAQPAPPPPPPRGLSPLLYVRLSGPPGMHTTFYQGRVPGREVNAPVTFGMRPGYVYRLKLSDLPGRPAVALYPTVEVIGVLCLPPGVNPADYPAPLALTPEDIESVLAGALVTKVVYLEHPERAVTPTPGPGQVAEREVPARRDPLAEAREYGRPVLIVRLGEREVSEEDLMAWSIPGTILMPGEKALPLPSLPPCIPWAGLQVCDPILGPRTPEEECLQDGGDVGQLAGLDRNGQLQGLDPTDTVAEYSDGRGRRAIACSNRVCLCAPRYAVIRNELPLARLASVIGPEGAQAVQGQVQVESRVPSLQMQQNEQLKGLKGRERPSIALARKGPDVVSQVKVLIAEHIPLGPGALLGTAGMQQLTEVERTRLVRQVELARALSRAEGLQGVEQKQGTAVAGRVEGLDVVTAVAETREFYACCNEEPRPPDKPLCLWKWANRQSVQAGDVVTFFLKYSNVGGRPISDIAVSDSLDGRLEYVPGSAQSDRNAVFTAQENEAGSVVLRWEITGRLLPGQSGVVRFQARVR